MSHPNDRRIYGTDGAHVAAFYHSDLGVVVSVVSTTGSVSGQVHVNGVIARRAAARIRSGDLADIADGSGSVKVHHDGFAFFNAPRRGIVAKLDADGLKKLAAALDVAADTYDAAEV